MVRLARLAVGLFGGAGTWDELGSAVAAEVEGACLRRFSSS